MRRGDFCNGRINCTRGPEVYAEGVETVRRPGCLASGVTEVVVLSDDTSADFIQSIHRMNWKFIHHDSLGTTQRYGAWGTSFVDAAIASQAAGFVGTWACTFSAIGARQANTWNGACFQL